MLILSPGMHVLVRKPPGKPIGLVWPRIRFSLKSLLTVVRFPSVIPALRHGSAAAVAAMETRVGQEFQSRPRTRATVGRASIYLNPRNTLAQNASMSVIGWYEPPVSELVRATCRRGACFVDVGANVGWYTFLAARQVGTTGCVVSIEPDPENYALLAKSLSENPSPQVKPLNLALSDHDGFESLFLSSEAASFHSIVRKVGVKSIPVRAITFDSLAKDLSIARIELMKIDVEGGEPKVLSGCIESLRSGRIRALTIEWSAEAWKESESLWAELARLFDVYSIVYSLKLTRLIPDPSLDAVCNEVFAAGRHGGELFLAWKGDR